MIPERTAIEVTSTVQGEDVAMTIDEAAIQHLMNVLTDLYEDPLLAVIREYSTNAWDSHIEAGHTRPIEVSTPTDLRPLFTVRDYGVGLSAEDIRSIYSRYGASTKRASNDAVGMLGLGCKSALAYCDAFTLCGVKDGQRIVVSIARDEKGAGTMTVLDSGETDEPNSVEVSIPAMADGEFEAKAVDFFSYWAPGTVLLNGQPPNELEGYRVGERYVVADRVRRAWEAKGRHDYRPLTIVMGNVSYPAPDGYSNGAVDSLPDTKRLVVTVPIGAVHFTPSREGLQDSERTRDAIDTALEDFQNEIAAVVTEAIEDAPDRPSAARALIEARAAFGKSNVPDLQWNGEDIPVVLSAEDLDPIPLGNNKTKDANLWRSKHRTGSHTPAYQITLDEAGEHPWILGYNNLKWSKTQRAKLDRYMEHHGLIEDAASAQYFITDAVAVPRSEWINGAVTAVNWQDVRAWKDPNKPKPTTATGGGVKYAGTYPTVTQGKYWSEHFPADDLPKSGRKLYYIVGHTKFDNRARAAAELLADDAYVVCVTDVREAKFKRLFPHARNALEAAERGAQGWYKSLSDQSREAIAIGEDLSGMYAGAVGLPADKVDDPELSKLCAIRELWESGTLQSRWRARARFVRVPDDYKPELDPETISGRYPLIDDMYRSTITSNVEHALLYVNAVYAANKNEEDK